MIRTDKLHQWAPTQMAMAHEPGQVLDDQQIEAAHAATDIGADDQTQPGPDGGAIAVLLVAAICCVLVALHMLARVGS